MPPQHRVLIVGVGSIGERHLRCFQATGRASVALLEINEDLRRTVAAQYAVTDHFAGLDDALQFKPQAAVIATPAHLHVPLASRVVDARVHVLIEKPLSVSMAGIDSLRQLMSRRGVTAAVAYVYRHHPGLQALRLALAMQRFGKPVQLLAISGQHFPTFRPAYRHIYYTDHATGGGAIQDALTHLVNAGEWLVGPVNRLAVDAAHQLLEGVDVEDTVHLLARHGSVLACYCLNQHQAPNEMTVTVVCERGTIQCEFHQQRWRWMAEAGQPWHDEPVPPLERDAMFTTQADHFLDAIEGKHAPACSLEEGIQTLRVNLAALASAEQGTWQVIPTSSHAEEEVT
jgi:predicted dehydrogenase